MVLFYFQCIKFHDLLLDFLVIFILWCVPLHSWHFVPLHLWVRCANLSLDSFRGKYKCLSFRILPLNLLQVYEDFSHIMFSIVCLLMWHFALPFTSTCCRKLIFFLWWWEALVMTLLTVNMTFTLHSSWWRLSFVHVFAWSFVTILCLQSNMSRLSTSMVCLCM